jgi:hypothetical protein
MTNQDESGKEPITLSDLRRNLNCAIAAASGLSVLVYTFWFLVWRRLPLVKR